MQLALRTTAATDATPSQAFFCDVIKARLVSEFCHGGIIINGDLFHANGAHGLHKIPKGEWTPENWVLFDVGGDDAKALALFEKHEGAHYDFFGLLAFVGLRAGRDDWMYCFEWCWLAMIGEAPKGRVTPEKLLLLVRSK